MKKNADNPIVKRILKALGLKKPIDIARLCNISQQNLNGYIARETLINLVENELSKRNINLDWIKTGQGAMTTGASIGEQPHTIKGGSETELVEDWTTRKLLEQIMSRLDDQGRHIEDAVKVITRYKDELENIQKAQTDLNIRIGNIRAAMDHAAKTGDVKDLGGDAVNE